MLLAEFTQVPRSSEFAVIIWYWQRLSLLFWTGISSVHRRLRNLPVPKPLRTSMTADQQLPARAFSKQVYPRQGQQATSHTRRHWDHSLPPTPQRLQRQRAPRRTLMKSLAHLQHGTRSWTRTSTPTERTAAQRSWRQLLQQASNGHVLSGQQLRHGFWRHGA